MSLGSYASPSPFHLYNLHTIIDDLYRYDLPRNTSVVTPPSLNVRRDTALATPPSRHRPRDTALATPPSRHLPRDTSIAVPPSRHRFMPSPATTGRDA
ncbi:MAG: hypothetical protein CSB49_05825 [Proteobacteria bacterium]|nr:MAG: hypothetical protein CSB49_05825 [Pseudomonadota bacterium]